MTARASTVRASNVSIESLRALLESHDAEYVGDWGKYLARYVLKTDRGRADVLLPKTTEIADYQRRVHEALDEIQYALGINPELETRSFVKSDFRTFRIRARPGSGISSIPFDEGVGLLESSKALIKSSAVAAFSQQFRPIVRGRSPMAVDRYMDRLQIGQTEVGSYVFTILLPCDEGPLFDHPGSQAADGVVNTLKAGISFAAEISQSGRVPSKSRIEEAGLSATFFESLYDVVDWAGGVSLELLNDPHSGDFRIELNEHSLGVLERTAEKINPERERTLSTVKGTITRLSEPNIRRRGSLDLRSFYRGRQKSIRIPFGFEDREVVISAFRQKADHSLSVSGYLTTEKSGRLRIEEPRKFKLVRSGSIL